MNFLRRVYLLLLGLLLVIMVTLLLLSPQAVGSWVGSISELSPVVRIIVTVVIDLFLLALMYIQVRPDPGSKVNGLVMRGSGAVTEVSVDSARERILKAVSDVPDVISAEATVKPVRGRAEIEMQVVVMGDEVRLPNKQKDINRALRQVIDKQLGLQIAGQPRIHLRIHGDEPVRPVAPVIPPPLPVIEKEIPVVVTPAVEPEEAPKPLSSLFGRREATPEPSLKEEIERKPISDKPLSPIVEPEPEVPKPRTGLFGGGWRSHDEEDEVEEEASLPSLKAEATSDSLSASKELPEPVTLRESFPAVKPVTPVETETTKSESDSEADSLKLDLDDELSHTDRDDFADDEPEEKMPDVITPKDEANEEPDVKKPDETTF